jgi:hypothetical protein
MTHTYLRKLLKESKIIQRPEQQADSQTQLMDKSGINHKKSYLFSALNYLSNFRGLAFPCQKPTS